MAVKNVMPYLSPDGINGMYERLLRLQLENSFELGWAPEDIMIITDFPYSIDGIESVVVEPGHHNDISSKVPAMVATIYSGLIGDGLYWLHDLDVFQQVPFTIRDVDLGRWDMAACYFGRLVKWSGGSIFFRQQAEDIFVRTYNLMRSKGLMDEVALTQLSFDDEKIHNRIKRLNPTWNFVPFNIGTCWRQADPKPLRMVHFNPFEGTPKLGIDSNLDFYRGDNRLGVQFASDRLLHLFGRHGIT